MLNLRKILRTNVIVVVVLFLLFFIKLFRNNRMDALAAHCESIVYIVLLTLLWPVSPMKSYLTLGGISAPSSSLLFAIGLRRRGKIILSAQDYIKPYGLCCAM